MHGIAIGICREKVHVPYTKPFITFLGNPKNPPVIMWNDRSATHGKDGKPVGTYGSATVAVDADYFMAFGIHFKNTAPMAAPGSQGGLGGGAARVRQQGGLL